MRSSWGSGCVRDASSRRAVELVRDVERSKILFKDLFRYTDGDAGDAGKGCKYRVIILEGVKGKTETIGIGSESTEFDEFLSKSQEVLDSVKWTGS